MTDCDVDLRMGGRIHIVMEAGEGMGKYRGTRWPMTGTFARIDHQRQLCYDAQSWTEGERNTTTIEHTNTNTITFAGDNSTTTVRLQIAITKIGPKAEMAAFGMKRGYKAYLDNLEALLHDG